MELGEWLTSRYSGVPAPVGPGGDGKGTMAVRIVAKGRRPGDPYRSEGIFVWSFSQGPDAGNFLSDAHRDFARGSSDIAFTTPWFGRIVTHDTISMEEDRADSDHEQFPTR